MGAVNSWEIQCVDIFGRPRSIRIGITAVGYVAIKVPAGEAAIVSPDQIDQVRSALDRAQE